MLKPHAVFATLFLLIISLSSAWAQSDLARSDKSRPETVTASTSDDRVRFTAPASVVQIRLEVYGSTGRKVFDNELRGGNVLDWLLQNGQAESLADDTYLCVVTAKNLSGKLTQRIGSVRVEKNRATLLSSAPAQMSAQQAEAVGPVEEDAALMVLKEGENQTATVVAHNGTEGQLIRGQGALSFRIGDFFAAKDREQMRLTEEGNLGIGTATPQARLDVAGMIRTQGLILPDGSVLTSAASISDLLDSTDFKGTIASLGKKKKGQQLMPEAFGQISGDGTANTIPKFTGANTIGNSALTEVGGKVGIGTPNPQGQLHIFGTVAEDVFAGMGPDLINGPAFNFGYAGFSFGRGAGFFNVRPDASAVAPNPSLRFATANVLRMIVTNTGNVGVGGLASATNPLDVNAIGAQTGGVGGFSEVTARFRQRTAGTHSAVAVDSLAGQDAILYFAENGSAIWGIRHDSDQAAKFQIRFQGGGANAPFFTIQTTGEVGIGTTTPASTLHVLSPSAQDVIIASSSAPGGTWFDLVNTGASGKTWNLISTSTANGEGAGKLLIRDASAGVRATFDTSGNLGIGLTSPLSRLHATTGTGVTVRGTNSSTSSTNSTSNSAGVFQITNSANNSNSLYADTLGNGSALFGFNLSQGAGVTGSALGDGDGVVGFANGLGFAGNFNGNVHISGNISKGGGSFKIDHPLDPENKYLSHSFVESPDMMNIYNGVITLDAAGEAVVELPEWFETLNTGFRYQLTAVGAPGPNLYIAEEVSKNRFKIAGGASAMKVSWQVTGIRQDPYANKHRIPVEEMKSETERGYYLHPDAYNQAEERGVAYVRNPEAMKQIKERKLKQQQEQ